MCAFCTRGFTNQPGIYTIYYCLPDERLLTAEPQDADQRRAALAGDPLVRVRVWVRVGLGLGLGLGLGFRARG